MRRLLMGQMRGTCSVEKQAKDGNEQKSEHKIRGIERLHYGTA